MGRVSRLGLQVRTMLYVFVGLLFVLGLFAYIGLQAIDRSTEMVFQERLVLAQTVGNAIDVALEHIVKDTAQMKELGLIDLDDGKLGPEKDVLRGLRKHLSTVDELTFVAVSHVSIIDREGTILWTEPYRQELVGARVDQVWLGEALQAGKGTIHEATPLLSVGGAAALVAVPFSDRRGETAGILAVGVKPAAESLLWGTSALGLVSVGESKGASKSRLPEVDYFIEVVDRQGRVVMGQGPLDQPGQISSHRALIEPLVSKGEAGVLIHDVDESLGLVDHIVVVVPLRNLPWMVVLEQDKDQALAVPNESRRRMMILGGFAILVALGVSWVTTRSVVNPVRSLTEAARRIAGGDLAQPIETDGEDELGLLARTFDEMRQRLRRSQEEIERWNRELEDRVEHRTRELSALVEASQAVISTLDLDSVFQTIMTRGGDVFQLADAGVLFLFDETMGWLEVHASFGLDWAYLSQVRLVPGEDIAGEVFQSGEARLLGRSGPAISLGAGMSEQNRARFLEATGGLTEARGVMGVPLVYEQRTIGSLIFYNLRNPGYFSSFDTMVLQALANQAAIAIENARLFREASTVGTLRELDRLKTEFVARASHELRTPLASAKSLTETLLRTDIALKPADQREFLEGINAACDRLARIIEDLLTVSRIEAGRLEVHQARVPLEPLIGRVVGQFQSAAPQLSFATAGLEAKPVAWADSDRLEDVLNNLLSNAVKYSLPGGTITVGVRGEEGSPKEGSEEKGSPPEEEASLVVFVADEGIGISASELPRLFQRFSRLENPLSRRAGGVGLGLYICKAYVEAMQGQIWVESTPGEGSTFFLRLPVAPREEAPMPPPEEPVAAPQGDGRGPSPGDSCILVVDDEPDVVRTIRINLEASGYQTRAATNGEECLAAVDEQRPDAIVLDIAMPDIDGLEVARSLRANPVTRDIPIVFLTAKAQEDDVLKGWQAGGDAYITKPFSPTHLCDAVAEALRLSPRARRERRLKMRHRIEEP